MSTSQADANAIWGKRPLPAAGQIDHIEVGPLELWLRSRDNEVWLGHRRSTEDPAESSDAPPDPTPPEDLEWSRWALKDATHHLLLRPVLPDRLLVVKPEHPFTLLRKAKARIFMRVPAWVRVEVVEGSRSKGATLADIPTEILSDTWWGDFLTGELGYWLTTRARRELRDELFEPHRVLSTVQLTNRSDDDLRVEKLALRVEHLSTYEKEGRLWAEETEVFYLGEEEGSDIRMDDKPPAEAAGAREISPARAQAKGLRVRTFERLKALSGW